MPKPINGFGNIQQIEIKLTPINKTLVTSKFISKVHTLLMSIPGIGATIATTLIAKLSDITKFSNGNCLVAFTGLDQKVKQSGSGLS